MEDESRRRQSHKNDNIRKDIKKVYNVSYRVSDDVVEHEEYKKLFEMEEDIKEYINVMVYQEESIDVDSYHAVVDTRCSKTVCGKSFMDAFTVVKGNDFKVGRKYEDENFKFEDGKVYNSSMSHSREVGIGELKTTLETSVVDANISLLLGMDYLKKWVVIIDTGKGEDTHREKQSIIQYRCKQVKLLEAPNTERKNSTQSGTKACTKCGNLSNEWS